METFARRLRRKFSCCFRAFINSLIGSPLPILRDANADQLRIGQEDVGRQSAVIAVQESAGDRRLVEDILVIEHHLPAGLTSENDAQIDGGVAAQPVIGQIVEHAPPRIILPVIVGSQRACPIGVKGMVY